MTNLPNPFCSAGVPHDAPPAEALLTEVSGKDHDPVSSAEISLSELCARGFDVNAFMADIDPPPLFLQRTG